MELSEVDQQVAERNSSAIIRSTGDLLAYSVEFPLRNPARSSKSKAVANGLGPAPQYGEIL